MLRMFRLCGGYALAPMTVNSWPALPLSEWKETYDTLHMWTQIVGKIRLASPQNGFNNNTNIS
jgi:hypothetical protein